VADELTSIITLLEQRKTAIENALTALREIGEVPTTTQVKPASAATAETPGRKQYKLSAAARERMSQGQRRRYAHLHTESVPAAQAHAATVETSGRKGKKRSTAVRRNMALAQKVRWAKIHGEAATAATTVAPAPEPPKAKRKISPEGLKRIIAATKKRWRLKRAADQAALGQAEA
jgi:hypothetical protein